MTNLTLHAAPNANQDGIPAYESSHKTTSVRDVIDLYKSNNAQFVSLLHVGMDGWIKSLDFVPFSEAHLRDVLTTGERADGSSLFKGSGLSASSSDISLRPRLDTAIVHPFTRLNEAKGICVLCHHYDKHGNLLPQSPSTILKAAQARVSQDCNGLQLYALGEVEYFLGRREASPKEAMNTAENGYHSTSPVMFGTSLRRRAMEILTTAGYHIKYGHGEVGFIPATPDKPTTWEQHEIEMSLMPLDRAADAVVLCQWILRNLAQQEGYSVSFEPIVRQGHAGNGLHFHMSPTTADGIHLSHYENGVTPHGHPVSYHDKLRPEVRAMIAGLCICGGSLMAFGNRSPETSFLRLSQGHEAPSQVQWDFFNRKALVRLPIQAINSVTGRANTPATVEFRLGDGSAHPHLLLAGIAQAFVHGYSTMEPGAARGLVDTCRVVKGQTGKTSVPKTPYEVSKALEGNRSIYTAGGVFPESLIDRAIENLKN